MGCPKHHILKNDEPLFKVTRKIDATQKTRVVDFEEYENLGVSYYPFGMEMPDRSGNTSEMRFSFNGQEKDDEVKGNGNHLDFGARAYDSRLGRFMSLDAHESRYPHLSPYNFVDNAPITHIDPDGNDNIIYLVALPTSKGLLDITFDYELVAKEANAMYKLLGVKTRVVVFKGDNFSESFMDDNDAVSYAGNPMDLNPKLGPGRLQYYHGNKYDALDLSIHGQNLITVSTFAADEYQSKLKVNSKEKAMAFGIVHGSSLNAGISHYKNNLDFKLGYKSYSFDAAEVLDAIDAGGTVEDFLIPEKNPNTIKAHNLKFGEDEARDNYDFNKAYYELHKNSGFNTSGMEFLFRAPTNPNTVDGNSKQKEGESTKTKDATKF